MELVWKWFKMNLTVLTNFDSFGVTRIFEEFGGFRDLKMEEKAFHYISKRILHVNEVLDNLESQWVIEYIRLITCQRYWNYYLTNFNVV